MKKALFVIIFILSIGTVFSQTEKGKGFFAGSTSLNYVNTKLEFGNEEQESDVFNLALEGGTFIADNFALAVSIGVTKQSQDDYDVSSYTLMPVLKWYLNLDGSNKLFLQGGLGYGNMDVDGEGNGGAAYMFGGGIAFFLSKSIDLEISVGSLHNEFGDKVKQNSLGVNLGLGIFF